jgi:transporter family protein
MKNLLIVVLPAFFWAISDIVTRISSNKINDTFGALMIAFGMACMMIMFSVFMIPNIAKEFTITGTKYIWLAILAGGMNAVGVFFFLRFLQQGGNFTQGLPIIQILLVSLGVIYGIIFFKDPLTIKTGIGLILGIGAIYFLSS